MKERPILFSAPMVRAILAGTKTQTRRLLKPEPPPDWLPQVGMYAPTLVNNRTGEQYPGPEVFGASDESFAVKCPYGQPKDRLWGRETFREYDHVWSQGSMESAVQFRADMAGMANGRMVEPTNPSGPWKPSIFMRPHQSRITLEITAVRVERLQDISEADAKAEGISHTLGEERFGWNDYEAKVLGGYAHARDSYASLWRSINGPGSWAANPFVWVVEFRRVEGGAS